MSLFRLSCPENRLSTRHREESHAQGGRKAGKGAEEKFWDRMNPAAGGIIVSKVSFLFWRVCSP
jgi:hypothetical protein